MFLLRLWWWCSLSWVIMFLLDRLITFLQGGLVTSLLGWLVTSLLGWLVMLLLGVLSRSCVFFLPLPLGGNLVCHWGLWGCQGPGGQGCVGGDGLQEPPVPEGVGIYVFILLFSFVCFRLSL